MAIDLTKGGRINLSKSNPTLTKLAVGLGWKPNQFSTGSQFDLDASVFLCKTGADGSAKLVGDDYFVFYNHTSEPQGAVVHSGDSKDGSLNIDFGNGVEVDEIVSIDLTKLSSEVDEISFIVTNAAHVICCICIVITC